MSAKEPKGEGVKDIIEFWNHKDGFVTSVQSSIVPRVGELINISKKTWEIVGVAFALDHSSGPFQERAMRANVAIEPFRESK